MPENSEKCAKCCERGHDLKKCPKNKNAWHNGMLYKVRHDVLTAMRSMDRYDFYMQLSILLSFQPYYRMHLATPIDASDELACRIRRVDWSLH